MKLICIEDQPDGHFSVSRKVAGKWLYVRDAWNSDGPPTQAPAKK
jgi:hypothetical protein